MRRAFSPSRALVACALLWPKVASAELEPAQIEVHAPPGCLDEAAFLDAVRAQTPNLRTTPVGLGARRLSIEIAREGTRFVGHLRVDERDGSSTVRDVGAGSCADLEAALVLVTALAIDAGPVARPAPRASPPSPPPAPREPTREKPKAPSKRRVSDMRLEAGALFGVVSALAPQASFGVEPFVDWSAWGRRGVAPSIRIAVSMSARGSASTSAGEASFHSILGRLSGCPAALVAGPLTARPCAGIDAGALFGRGTGAAQSLSATRPWVAPTISGRAQIAIASRLYAEVDAGVFIPLVRDRFVFDAPRVDIYRAPSFGGFGAIGLGATLF